MKTKRANTIEETGKVNDKYVYIEPEGWENIGHAMRYGLGKAYERQMVFKKGTRYVLLSDGISSKYYTFYRELNQEETYHIEQILYLKPINSFSNIEWGYVYNNSKVIYKCKYCGELLKEASRQYYSENHTVATEDYPLQLWENHKHYCNIFKNEVNKKTEIAIAHNPKLDKEETRAIIFNIL